ncbi:MAG: hypothetical protein KDD01_00970 [Phaeodactylibacter sp.]|nr:hypothetical protein [Phaeodactylibacter sp.]
MKTYRIRDRLFIPLVFLVGLVGITSCTKENSKPQETTKELMATASSEITVAEGEAITFTDLSLANCYTLEDVVRELVGLVVGESSVEE